MKLIAHQGTNLNGPNPLTENSPDQIQHCIESGVDVEIDVRYDPKTERLWLGHDEPQHAVTWWWLDPDDLNTFGFTVKTLPLSTHLRMGRVVIIILASRR